MKNFRRFKLQALEEHSKNDKNRMDTSPRVILGIGGIHNCGQGHDASASLIINGILIAAVEEERFSRVKKHVRLGYPIKSIEYCLKEGGIDFGNISDFAIESRVGNVNHLIADLKCNFGKSLGRTHLVGHHMAHVASTVFAAPFDKGAFLVVDAHGGLHGHGISTVVGGFDGNRVEVLEEIWSPFSLGLAWAYITEALGYDKQTDAGKVMALAAFSEDQSFFRLFDIIDSSFISVPDASKLLGLKIDKSNFSHISALAYAVQYHTEQCIKKMVTRLITHYNTDSLCMAGGVALNSITNGQLLSEGLVKHLFIQPAADDSGLSLGAAYYVNHITHQNKKTNGLKDVFLGPQYSDKQIFGAIKESGCPFVKPKNRYHYCARLLAKGKILGWFQGRMEYGPRALGNRSILCDPRDERMKDLLNLKVKHREVYRPFAASVLADEADDYFMINNSPYMLLVGKPKHDNLRAVTHVDGTTRLQTITETSSPELYLLLQSFKTESSIPVLLNTSLNVMGEPIVENPEQALRCFLETEMDVLCIGKYIVTKGILPDLD